MVAPVIRDGSWVRQAFLVKKAELDRNAGNSALRTLSTNQFKFTDTRPGGNVCINPPPQFTRFADLRPVNGGRAIGSTGLGSYYSEAIDDNNQIIHMRFGVPQFNSLATFFTGFYNAGASRVARTGRANGFFYSLGRVAGAVVPLVFWKLLTVHLIGVGARFFLRKPSSKFYSLKPAMPIYWSAVQTIVNQICVNTGIVPRVGGEEATADMNGGYVWTDADSAKMHELLPDIFTKKGQVDVFALANRGQRLARKDQQRWKKIADDNLTTLSAMTARVQQMYNEKLSDTGRRDWKAYQDQWVGSSGSAPAAADSTGQAETMDKKSDNNPGFLDFFEAEMDDGAAFVSLRVNPTGGVQESFSNQTGESEIQSKINSVSSQSRSTSFNVANGNIVGIPFMEQVVGAVKELAGGLMDSMQISGLATLAGAAFVDIPEQWQSSSSQLPRSSYTVDLMTPYNNPISRLTNIFIPLAMLLAAVLPKSTGKQSYTEPFLVELYDRGRNTIRLGIVDSLTISRGEGNAGWDNKGRFLNVKVTFTVKDLSTVLHMPITQGFTLSSVAEAAATGTAIGAVVGGVTGAVPAAVVGGVIGGATGTAVATGAAALDAIGSLFDDETVFTDYMSTLASVGMADMIYPMRQLKRNLTQLTTKWDSQFSTARFASFAGDTMPGQLISAFYVGTIK